MNDFPGLRGRPGGRASGRHGLLHPAERALMPPHPSSHLRETTEWAFDPWGSAEARRAWDHARKRRWIASLTARDWDRLAAAADQARADLARGRSGGSINDLDAPIRVGLCVPEEVCRFSGVKFGELRGFALLAWPKV